MAATLANGGVCPITDERCIGSRPCRDVLSLMNSCGMYDYSGQYAFHVGLPAKSGVSGVVIVVIPNLCGFALWSPPLDRMGNSCRGIEFCKELIANFNFHNYDSLVHNDEVQKFDPRRRVGDRQKDQVVSLLFAAKAGDINTIRRMYMQGCNMELADYDKRTALHLAASEDRPEVILFLLNTAKVRPDPKDRWHRTPLQDARGEGHLTCVHLLEKAMSIRETADHSDEEAQSRDGQKQSSLETGRIRRRVTSGTRSVPSSDDSGDDRDFVDDRSYASSDSAFQSMGSPLNRTFSNASSAQ
ncbi:Protein GLNA-1 a [Aphelenchoides avenae]|nr:Protein GLNA-1 a [Aphelenchus avenae]